MTDDEAARLLGIRFYELLQAELLRVGKTGLLTFAKVEEIPGETREQEKGR